jgi:ferredoxin
VEAGQPLEKKVMLAQYGYGDGSGSYFITIDTDKCTGCGDCVTACPAEVFEVVNEDPNDPMNDAPVALVREDKKKKLAYECSPCKPAGGSPQLPCTRACRVGAVDHSW